VIGDEYVPYPINREPLRAQQRGVCGGAAIAEASWSSPGDRGDDAANIHFADSVVPAVCDEQITRPVKCYVSWPVQSGVSRRPTVPQATGPAPCHCGYDPIGINFAHAVGPNVCYVHVPIGVKSHITDRSVG